MAPSLSILGHAIGENLRPFVPPFFVFSLACSPARSFLLVDARDTRRQRARTVACNRSGAIALSADSIVNIEYSQMFPQVVFPQYGNYNRE
jgi:hypothetical protein